MPIYEYSCECGARLESLERVGTVRERCAELCVRAAGSSPALHGDAKAAPLPGEGHVARELSLGMIRGDGREAKEKVFDPCKQSNRPGGGCDGNEY